MEVLLHLFLIPAMGYIVRWGCWVGFSADLNPMGGKIKFSFPCPTWNN